MQQSTTFQGKSIRVRRESKNRYEFRSPYTVQFGTAAEIERLISDHMSAARHSAIELAAARHSLKMVAAEDGVALETKPVLAPAPVVTAPAPVVTSSPAPARTPRVPTPRRKSHSVEVVSFDASNKPKRRPNGLAYLRQLMAQAE